MLCYNISVKRQLTASTNLDKEDKAMASFGKSTAERQANMRGATTQLRWTQQQASNARRAGNENAAQGWESEYRRLQRRYNTAAAAMRRRGELG